MSDSLLERVGAGGGGGTTADVNVVSWGGALVSPAAAKGDAGDTNLVVPEVGSRAQLFNGASWDRARSGLVGPLTAPFTGVQTVIPLGVFNAVAPVLVDGQAVSLQFDSSGQLKTSGGGGGASIGLVGAPVPLSANYTGFIDAAGNLQGARVYDLDTGAGTELTLGVVLRAFAGGGSVEIGTTANPVVVSTAQLPAALVGARLDTNVGAWLGSTAPTVGSKTSANSIPVVLASDQAQLPAALVGGRLDINNGAWLGSTAPTVGLKASASSLPVVIASDQGAITTQLPAALVGGRLDENVGAWLGSTAPTVGLKASASSLPVVIASDQGAITTQLPAALVGGRLDENVGAWLGSTAPTVGQKTSANSIPVVLASDQSAVANPTQPTTGTTTSVASNVANVTLLAANANRKGAMITNDGSNNLFLKLGATASSTSFTAKLIAGAYYELPYPVYTGVIDGIWDVATGSARITELT